MHPLEFTHDVTFSMANYVGEKPCNDVLDRFCGLPPLVIAANIELFFNAHDINLCHRDALDVAAGSRVIIDRDNLLSRARRVQLDTICNTLYDLPKMAKMVIEAIQRRFIIAASRINQAQDRSHDTRRRFERTTPPTQFNAVLPDINRGLVEYCGGIAVDNIFCAIELMWMLYDGDITVLYRNRQGALVPLLSLDCMIRTAMNTFTNPALWIPFHDLCISAAVGVLITEHYTLATLQAMSPLELAYVDSAVFGKHADVMATHLLHTLHDLQDRVIPSIRYVDSLMHAITLDAPTVSPMQVSDWIDRSYGTYCQNAISQQSGYMGTIGYNSDQVLDGFRTNIYFWYCYSAHIHFLAQDFTSSRLSDKHLRTIDTHSPFTIQRYKGWTTEISLYLRRKHTTPLSLTIVNVVFVVNTNTNRVEVHVHDGAGGGGSKPPYIDYDGDCMRDPSWCKPLDGQVEVTPKVSAMLAKLGIGDAVCMPSSAAYAPPRGKRKGRAKRY